MQLRRTEKNRPLLTTEEIARYVGPDNDDLKTTFRGGLLHIIDNNNNERDLLVHHKPLLEIDDDLKVPFDDYFDDISAES